MHQQDVPLWHVKPGPHGGLQVHVPFAWQTAEVPQLVELQTHTWLALQTGVALPQLPQVPPQPSGPQFLPLQFPAHTQLPNGPQE